jgi:hypothetical protein
MDRAPYMRFPLVAVFASSVLVGAGLVYPELLRAPPSRVLAYHSTSGRVSLPQPLRLGSPIIATSPSYLPNREIADRAAWYPHIPCTPAPGGVDDEHIYRSRAEVA